MRCAHRDDSVVDDSIVDDSGTAVCTCRPHPTDPKHPDALDDALALLDAARDAALFEGTPPALGSPSTEVRPE
jgi:hypothetical protein